MLTSYKLNPVEELEIKCKEILKPDIFDYITGGAGTEWGMLNNRNAFQAHQIIPRVIQNVSTIDTSLNVLGIIIQSPIIFGPCAFQKLVTPNGEIETAKAAEELDTIMTLSTMSSYTIEDVAESFSGPKWFQLYIYKNRELTESLVKRAQNAGYKAIVVTVDVPVMGNRQRDIKNKFCLPSNVDAANFRESKNLSLSSPASGSKIKEQTDQQFESNLTWDLIDWLHTITNLPIILKGVLHPEDAMEALKHNISGIIVSNHGGRQLDSVIASIDALPSIKKVLKNQMPIFVDSGIRCGEDIFKAIALGADAILIGRPILWSLAIGGKEQLIATTKMLQEELKLTMRLSGCASLKIIHERGLSLLNEKRDLNMLDKFNETSEQKTDDTSNVKGMTLFRLK